MALDKEALSQSELQTKYDTIIDEATQVAKEIQSINYQILEIHCVAPDLGKNLEEIRDMSHERGNKFDPYNPVCPPKYIMKDTDFMNYLDAMGDIDEPLDSDLFAYELDEEDKEANRQISELQKQLYKPRSRLNTLKKQFQKVMLQAMRHKILLNRNIQNEAQIGIPPLPIIKSPDVKQKPEISSSDSDKFNPLDYGGTNKGKELCIVWSYNNSNNRNLRKLAQMLKNKANIRYTIRGKTRDPYEWYSNNPKAFKNHIYKIRKKAEKHPKVALIPQDYWKSYQ